MLADCQIFSHSNSLWHCGLENLSPLAVKPIRKSAGIRVDYESQLTTIVESPLLSCCQLLYRAGIRTVYSSAHSHGRTAAQLWVEASSLTKSQIELAFKNGATYSNACFETAVVIFIFPFAEDTKLKEIGIWAESIAKLLILGKTF